MCVAKRPKLLLLLEREMGSYAERRIGSMQRRRRRDFIFFFSVRVAISFFFSELLADKKRKKEGTRQGSLFSTKKRRNQ